MLLYKRSHDLADAKHRLWKILNRCARSETPELLRLAGPWMPGRASSWPRSTPPDDAQPATARPRR